MTDNTQSEYAILSGKKLLVAEDMKLNQFLMTQLLAGHNLSLTFVSNGLEAVKACQEHVFDLIVLDIRMPLLDGVGACRAIRKLTNPNAQAPIVAITAHMFEEEQLRFFTMGMNAAVIKPVEKDTFLPLLSRLLSSPLAEEKYLLSADLDSSLQIDLSYLQRIGNNDPSFIKMMLDSFLENAESLQQRLDLAISNTDTQQIGDIAHQLKFSLGVLGIRALDEKLSWLQESASRIETADVEWFLERGKRLQIKIRMIAEHVRASQQHYQQLLTGNT